MPMPRKETAVGLRKCHSERLKARSDESVLPNEKRRMGQSFTKRIESQGEIGRNTDLLPLSFQECGCTSQKKYAQ